MTEINALDYAKANLARTSLDQCLKCTICETQCPVMRVTPNFSGPKFVGPQAERFRKGQSVDRSLDYCSGCSICTTVCPHGVKIAELNAQARAVMKADNMPLRDRLITQTELEGKLLTPLAPIANAAIRNRPIRKLVQAVIGVHADAPTPVAQSTSFLTWWKGHEKAVYGGPYVPRRPQSTMYLPSETKWHRGPIVFFHGCAGAYFEVSTSIATVEVLEHLGYRVIVPKQGCCGLASQSNGLFNDASPCLAAGTPTAARREEPADCFFLRVLRGNAAPRGSRNHGAGRCRVARRGRTLVRDFRVHRASDGRGRIPGKRLAPAGPDPDLSPALSGEIPGYRQTGDSDAGNYPRRARGGIGPTLLRHRRNLRTQERKIRRGPSHRQASVCKD